MYEVYRNIMNPKTVIEKIVGRGLQLSPMRVAGKTVSNTGVDRITQCLYCLFSTRRGERLFQPEYGSRVYDHLFEPNDFVLCDLIEDDAMEDIKMWEPRIDAQVKATVQPGSSEVSLQVIYSIKGDSTKYSFVYNFNREIRSLGGETYGQ